MSIDDILGEEKPDKYYNVNDILLKKDRIWFEAPSLAVNVLTGELKDVRLFENEERMANRFRFRNKRDNRKT